MRVLSIESRKTREGAKDATGESAPGRMPGGGIGCGGGGGGGGGEGCGLEGDEEAVVVREARRRTLAVALCGDRTVDGCVCVSLINGVSKNCTCNLAYNQSPRKPKQASHPLVRSYIAGGEAIPQNCFTPGARFCAW